MNNIQRILGWQVQSHQTSLILRYGIAILSVGIVTIFRLLLKPFLGDAAPFIVFTLAIAISAMFGGLRPGLFSTFLSTIAVKYFFIQPHFTLRPNSEIDLILIFVFIITGIFISIIGELVDRLNRRALNILESITDAFVVLDKQWKVVYLNKNAEPFFLGRKRNYLTGKNIWDEFPRGIQTLAYKKLQLALKLGKSIRFEEFFPRINKWLEFRIYPSKDSISIYFQDITQHKEVDQRKDNFISIAAHELKTPVTSIKIFTQLLQKKLKQKKDKQIKNYVNHLENQINRLTKLIEQLLDVSQIQSGKIEFKKVSFDIVLLTEEIIENTRGISPKHKIILKSKRKIEVFADRDRIAQVIINLIINAIKYTQNGHSIIVKIVPDKEKVTVSVQDFGLGIAREKQDRLFERFYRVEGQVGKAVPGLGMGLYIAAEIIKRHHGKIWVDSEIGKGSTFFLTLPKNT